MDDLFEKINKIHQLPDSDDKSAVVSEIEALEVFTDEERERVFANRSILWILKNYTIRELKDRASKAIKKIEVNLGDVISCDVISFGMFRDVTGVVLEVCGRDKDRVTVLCNDYGTLKVIEGVSVYNCVKHNNIDVTQIMKALEGSKK